MHLNFSRNYWIKNCYYGTRFLHLSHKLLYYMLDTIYKCIYFQSVYRTVCKRRGCDVRWFLLRFICGVPHNFCVEYQSEMYKMRLRFFFTLNICSLFGIRQLATTLPNTFSLASCCDSYTNLCFFFVFFFSCICACVYLPAWILYNERKRRPNTIAFHRGLTQLGWHDSQYRSIHVTIWHNVMTIPLLSPFIYSQRSTECALVVLVSVCVCVWMRAPLHVFSVAFLCHRTGFTICGFITGEMMNLVSFWFLEKDWTYLMGFLNNGHRWAMSISYSQMR